MAVTKPKASGGTNPTYQALLLAGEELMGWQGIDAVSVRDINARAGQKNTSAIRYHFKNKAGLIEAILNQRMSHLDSVRRDLFDSLMREGAAPGMAELVHAQVWPLIDATLNQPEWKNYILFLAQVISVRSAVSPDIWQRKLDRTSRDLFAAMRALNPEPSQPLWEQRVRDMMQMVIGSLCERVRVSRDRTPPPQLAADIYSPHLLATAQLILEAPEPA